jgi:hypothetical protein
MKMKHCSLVILSSTLFVISCSKDGSNGVDGTNGKTALTKTTKEAAGANCKYGGTKFQTGIDANNNGTLDDSEVTVTETKYVCDGAGAIYSSWIDVNVSDKVSRLPEEQNFSYKQLLPAEALTADIVNNGLVFLFYKSKNGVITNVNREGYLTDVALDGYSFSYYAGYGIKEKYLSFLTNGYYVQINDNGSALRYVVIPAANQARSTTDLKKMPYSEIAKLYNITD